MPVEQVAQIAQTVTQVAQMKSVSGQLTSVSGQPSQNETPSASCTNNTSNGGQPYVAQIAQFLTTAEVMSLTGLRGCGHEIEKVI